MWYGVVQETIQDTR